MFLTFLLLRFIAGAIGSATGGREARAVGLGLLGDLFQNVLAALGLEQIGRLFAMSPLDLAEVKKTQIGESTIKDTNQNGIVKCVCLSNHLQSPYLNAMYSR